MYVINTCPLFIMVIIIIILNRQFVKCFQVLKAPYNLMKEKHISHVHIILTHNQ